MTTRLGWVVKGLRTGVMTTRYPVKPDPGATAGVRTHPLLRPEVCAAANGCDACVRVCLPDALAIEAPSARGEADSAQHATLWLDLGRCIGCGLCAQACPEGAFVMVSEHELAARDRGMLRLAQPVNTSPDGH